MNVERVDALLAAIGRIAVGVVGDYCLDAYWLLDERDRELSIETGKPTHSVHRQRYSLGGAGNVAANLAALQVARIETFGVLGDDVFGREMVSLLDGLGSVDRSGMLIQADDWDTPVYAKPYIGLEEQERIDFGRHNRIAPATQTALLDLLAGRLGGLDALIINQQLPHGLHTAEFVRRMDALAGGWRGVSVLDARDAALGYRQVILKLNASEAARLCGEELPVSGRASEDDVRRLATKIQSRTGRPVVVTRGDRGILAADGADVVSVPGILTLGATDPVGAGDTAAAVLTCALAAGASLGEAVELANFGAAVVVRKLRQTGSASPQEIRSMCASGQYVHRPELAEDPRKARFRPGTDVEIVAENVDLRSVSHVVFDHDGTISTLRQGWEDVMRDMMVKAVMGERYADAPEAVYARVVERVTEYIDQSTGVETIVQMTDLVEIVRQFGLVPPEQTRTPSDYKAVYNEALMRTVNERLRRFRAGSLSVEDLTIKGAVEFVRMLSARGVTLYLASGTDHADVRAEAEALGYAGLFTGGVYGWAGQGTGSAKQAVIEGIVTRHGLSGRELACVGDGPVEMRLAKRHGGWAVGVASDEVRRWGGNASKRARLIKAGADLVMPDFSDQAALRELLGGA